MEVITRGGVYLALGTADAVRVDGAPKKKKQTRGKAKGKKKK